MEDFLFTPFQQQVIDLPESGKFFLHGQAGSGKTTAAVARLHEMIRKGIPAESILVLVPQRSLAEPFREVIHRPDFFAGGEPSIVTIGGLAQRMISLFWPLVAGEAGFASPQKPPRYLTLETAQYYLAGLVEPLLQKGYFEGVTVDPNRLYSQILDNLNKSAVVGFPPDEIASRLIGAWTGKPAQSIIYQQAQECAQLFRQFCLQENLLDFSLQLSLFTDQLWPSLLCRQYLTSTYRHLIYDNAEEDYPIAHDLLLSWLPELDSALILSDDGGGFRTFMGADPASSKRFAASCDLSLESEQSFVKSCELESFEKTLSESLLHHKLEGKIPDGFQDAFSIQTFRFFPQSIDWIASKVQELVEEKHVPPEEIAILTPFLSDALRYALQSRFDAAGLQLSTFRPSRGLRDEPAVRAVLTLAKLGFPNWGIKPSRDEVRNAMLLCIEGCDYIRADLISQILYSVSEGALRSFEPIKKEMQQRLTFVIGERFEKLRDWLEKNKPDGSLELDIFISRLFGEVLSQPGFKFHQNYDAAAAISRLVESARKFRQVMGVEAVSVKVPVAVEYLHLVESGILSAQYQTDWTAQTRRGSVLVAPAFSFLMHNTPVRYQFWLDIGSQGWWARLDQPLTHPFVLSRNWLPNQLWTDAQENAANQAALNRVVTGMIRRCREHIFMCSLSLNEQGNEERGALMMGVQTILRKLSAGSGGKNV